jgi:hypothetical protein
MRDDPKNCQVPVLWPGKRGVVPDNRRAHAWGNPRCPLPFRYVPLSQITMMTTVNRRCPVAGMLYLGQDIISVVNQTSRPAHVHRPLSQL